MKRSSSNSRTVRGTPLKRPSGRWLKMPLRTWWTAITSSTKRSVMTRKSRRSCFPGCLSGFSKVARSHHRRRESNATAPPCVFVGWTFLSDAPWLKSYFRWCCRSRKRRPCVSFLCSVSCRKFCCRNATCSSESFPQAGRSTFRPPSATISRRRLQDDLKAREFGGVDRTFVVVFDTKWGNPGFDCGNWQRSPFPMADCS